MHRVILYNDWALIIWPDVGQRHIDYPVEEHASSHQCNVQGHCLGASAGTEGLHHIWTDEEGDRESRGCHPSQYH